MSEVEITWEDDPASQETYEPRPDLCTDIEAEVNKLKPGESLEVRDGYGHRAILYNDPERGVYLQSFLPAGCSHGVCTPTARIVVANPYGNDERADRILEQLSPHWDSLGRRLPRS